MPMKRPPSRAPSREYVFVNELLADIFQGEERYDFTIVSKIPERDRFGNFLHSYEQVILPSDPMYGELKLIIVEVHRDFIDCFTIEHFDMFKDQVCSEITQVTEFEIVDFD